MLISTKGRYALSVMIDLAEHNSGDYIPLVDIADRQSISEKYLESIVSKLSREGMVVAMRGKGGGYRLSKAPEQYTALEVIECIEGNLAPVSVIDNIDETTTAEVMEMWKGLHKTILDYLQGITIDDLKAKADNFDFVI